MCQRKGKSSPPGTLRSSGLDTNGPHHQNPKQHNSRYSFSSASDSSLQPASSCSGSSQNLKPPSFFSIRGLFVFLGFLGSGLVFAVRVNINLAIVAMVKAANNPEHMDTSPDLLRSEHSDLCFDPALTTTNSSLSTNEPIHAVS